MGDGSGVDKAKKRQRLPHSNSASPAPSRASKLRRSQSVEEQPSDASRPRSTLDTAPLRRSGRPNNQPPGALADWEDDQSDLDGFEHSPSAGARSGEEDFGDEDAEPEGDELEGSGDDEFPECAPRLQLAPVAAIHHSQWQRLRKRHVCTQRSRQAAHSTALTQHA